MITECLQSEIFDRREKLSTLLTGGDKKFQHYKINRTMAFHQGPLAHCIENHITHFFTAEVSKFASEIYYVFLRSRRDLHRRTPVYHIYKKVVDFFLIKVLRVPESFWYPKQRSRSNIVRLCSDIIYIRYCPAEMFFIEGIS